MTQTLSSDRFADDLHDTAALLGSRVCHDLISPMGAISNGLELLSMSGLEKTPELHLIEESVENANARLKFFRVAFGAATGGQIMSRPDLMKLLEGVFTGGRISVKWDAYADPTRSETKIAFLAILCLETCLPLGGEITVNTDRGEWKFHAYGSKIRFEPNLWAHLKHGAQASAASADVQFPLLGDALRVVHRTPLVGHSDSAVSLRY